MPDFYTSKNPREYPALLTFANLSGAGETRAERIGGRTRKDKEERIAELQTPLLAHLEIAKRY